MTTLNAHPATVYTTNMKTNTLINPQLFPDEEVGHAYAVGQFTL